MTWQHGSLPYPGIPELLTEVSQAGIPMAVLSNKVHDFTVKMVAQIFYGLSFDCVLGQREGVPQKPEPQGALEIAKQIGVAPSSCLFVGDSTVDYLTATNAGMEAVCVDWGHHDRSALESAGATKIVSTREDLATAILGWFANPSAVGP